MSGSSQLADMLGQFVHRSGYSMGQLNRLSGVPKRTIANWLGGRVQKPRKPDGLLKLAAVLHLNEAETNQLLQAVDYPPLTEFLNQAGTEKTVNLLSPWIDSHQRHKEAPFQAIADLPYFVGREQELQAIKGALVNGRQVMICSLQGMGGVGKTALTAHVAYLLRPYFPDGVLWSRVDVSDAMSTLQSFASAYGHDVSQYADLNSRSRVVRELLAHKRALIVLDNVQSSEQVQPLLPPTTGACAVIITTRRRDLAVTSGGHRFQLGPFDKEKDDALQLFSKLLGKERAGREEATLDQIAALLGYLPLAVAIAASRIAYEPGWSTDEFLQRLQQEKTRLDLLTYDNQSVRLSVNLSYEMLQPVQQQFFAALGAFASEDLSLEAVAWVTERSHQETRDHLRHLHGLSLVQLGRGTRYRLHPLLHDYAREQLEAMDSYQDVLARMVTYFINYAATHRRNYEALQLETDNILAALETAFAEEMKPALVRGTNAFFHFLETRGLYELAEIHLRRTEKAARTLSNALNLATVLLNLGYILRKQEKYAQAKPYLQDGLTLAQQVEDKALISALSGELGVVMHYLGDGSQTKEYYETGLALARQLNDPELTSTHLTYLGVNAFIDMDYHQSEAYYRKGLALARKGGNQKRASILLNNLGEIARVKGRNDEAETYYQEGLVLAQQIGYRELVCILLNNLGEVALDRGEYEQAQTYYEEGLTLARQMKQQTLIALLLQNLGKLAFKQSNPAQAEAYFRQSLDLIQERTGQSSSVLNEWAELLLQQGNLEAASAVFNEALTLAREGKCEGNVATARYGLAQVAAAAGDMAEARHQGEESLAIFETLCHARTADVQRWLTSLPQL